MRSGSRRLFIYYRLDEGTRCAAAQAVRQAQQALRAQHPGLQAELLQSPAPSPTGERTLMETYAMDAQARAAGVEEALQAAIEAEMCRALQPWLAPRQRHVEVFVDLPLSGPPCAS